MGGHERPAPKSYSIAEARNHLPNLIHEVEEGRPAEITRRGKPVAMLVSAEEYRRLVSSRPTFAEAYGAWRESVDLDELDLTPGAFDALRDRSLGRDVKL